MNRDEMADLTAFAVVAEERNFTRAAAKLGMSQSALSQIVKRLEARLDLRLLARTTRSVAPTQAGERLMRTLAPMLRDLEESITALSAVHNRPEGMIRVTSVEHAAKTVLTPAIAELVADYPEISVEVFVDYGLSDVVTDRFDAGVRLGEHVAKDMIALRISKDIPMAIVAAPAYLRAAPPLDKPQNLPEHSAINLRLPTSETLNAWRLSRNGREMRVRVGGSMIFNSIDLILDAALLGAGLAYLPLDQVTSHLESGRLSQLLGNWTPPLPGYHLYYPSRHHNAAAFSAFLEVLRRRVRKAG